MRRGYKGIQFLVLLLLAVTLLLACNKGGTAKVDSQKDNTETQITKHEENKEATPTAAAAKTATPEATPTEALAESTEEQEPVVTPELQSEPVLQEIKEIRDLPSADLVKEIKIGWNLGNTLDATGGGNTLNSETSWGNPLTTEAMIKAVKDAGFNIIRIPTTWGNHLGAAPDYTIDKAWLDRVQEIVDYAINNDMFVIVNMHHEEWYSPSYANLESAKAILTKTWAQIADRFQGYDEHLIFEGMNEPRVKGSKFEWNGGDEEGRDVINQLNAAFVETIRNAGGNNPLRHLMLPCYAASADSRAWTKFIVPEDDKIIVSIHAYTPYNFALNKSGTSEWTPDNVNDTRDIDNLMNNLYNNFVSKGQPVILGEFGAMDKNGNLEARTAWAEYYIRKAAEKGIPCIWWDNGAFSGTGELFGLLNRRALTWQFPEVVDALMKGLE